ncbi:hypothetical protein D3C80_516090 [compost metagenome]
MATISGTETGANTPSGFSITGATRMSALWCGVLKPNQAISPSTAISTTKKVPVSSALALILKMAQAPPIKMVSIPAVEASN